MTPAAPTLHTADPQIPGFIYAYIDPPPSYDQVIWYTSHSPTGPWQEIDVSWSSAAIGADGLALIMRAGLPGAVVYVQAKLHDATGYGAVSAVMMAVVSNGPPQLTQQQELSVALGQPLAVGDQVALYPAPAKVLTVQADGSLA